MPGQDVCQQMIPGRLYMRDAISTPSPTMARVESRRELTKQRTSFEDIERPRRWYYLGTDHNNMVEGFDLLSD